MNIKVHLRQKRLARLFQPKRVAIAKRKAGENRESIYYRSAYSFLFMNFLQPLLGFSPPPMRARCIRRVQFSYLAGTSVRQ